MVIKKRWVMEHGEGHWVVTNGVRTLSCDDTELMEVIAELEKDIPIAA